MMSTKFNHFKKAGNYSDLFDELVQTRKELKESNTALEDAKSQLEYVTEMIKRAFNGDEVAEEYLVLISGVLVTHSGPIAQFSKSEVPSNTQRSTIEEKPQSMHQIKDVTFNKSGSDSGDRSSLLESQMLQNRISYYDSVLEEHSSLVNHTTKSQFLSKQRCSSASKSKPSPLVRSTSECSSLDQIQIGDLISDTDQLPSRKVSFSTTTNQVNPRRNSDSTSLEQYKEAREIPHENLFVPPQHIKKTLPPMSAVTQKKKDASKVKPRNPANSSNSNISSGRFVPYEVIKPTTKRPPSGRCLSAFGRSASNNSAITPDLPTKNNSASLSKCSIQNTEVKQKLYPSRPQCVDQWAAEEAAMRSLEQQFQRHTIDLQRRLGIDEQSIVLPN